MGDVEEVDGPKGKVKGCPKGGKGVAPTSKTPSLPSLPSILDIWDRYAYPRYGYSHYHIVGTDDRLHF
jgi:hypothetical protein